MFTPLLIVSVAAAWQLGVNKCLCGSWGSCAGTGGWTGAGQRGSLRDVDHQVIISIQGIIPAACIAEHLPRDCTQDRRGGHLSGRQWGQGCPHPSPRTPAGEGQRPSHRAVRGSHRHLQQGGGGRNTGRGCQEGMGPLGGRHCPLRQFWGVGKGQRLIQRVLDTARPATLDSGAYPTIATSESQTSKCLRVRGSSDGGSDEGGRGLQETRRERLGPASPGRHLGSPCDGTAIRAAWACLPASRHLIPLATTGLLSLLLRWGSLVWW